MNCSQYLNMPGISFLEQKYLPINKSISELFWLFVSNFILECTLFTFEMCKLGQAFFASDSNLWPITAITFATLDFLLNRFSRTILYTPIYRNAWKLPAKLTLSSDFEMQMHTTTLLFEIMHSFMYNIITLTLCVCVCIGFDQNNHE